IPCLCTSPERKSTSKAPKRVLRVRAVASMAGFLACRYSITNCLGPKEYVPDQMRVPCNSPEFKELYDQNQNTYRPYRHHCAASRFAPMSAYSGESTVEDTTEWRRLCPRLEFRQWFCWESCTRFANQPSLLTLAFFCHFAGEVPAQLFGAQCWCSLWRCSLLVPFRCRQPRKTRCWSGSAL